MLDEKILLARAGNFTASENHRLMSGWDKKLVKPCFPEFEELYPVMKELEKKPLVKELQEKAHIKVTGEFINATWQYIQNEKPPAGLATYAKEKAIEEFFYPDPSLSFSNAHTRNGEEREAECMALLAEKTGLNFINTGEEQVHIHADEVGCTPDGIVLDDLDLVLTGAEVKCKSPLEHMKNMLITDSKQLMENAFDHFVQIQTQMLVTGADHWYFANYNPCIKDEYRGLEFGYIIIERDNDFIEILVRRLEVAKKIKAVFYLEIEKLRSAA